MLRGRYTRIKKINEQAPELFKKLEGCITVIHDDFTDPRKLVDQNPACNFTNHVRKSSQLKVEYRQITQTSNAPSISRTLENPNSTISTEKKSVESPVEDTLTSKAPKANVDAKIDALIQILNNYKLNRENYNGSNQEYKYTFFCKNWGFSKTQKLEAVEALKDALMGKGTNNLKLHLDALRNRDLGNAIRTFLVQTDTSSFLNGKNINTVSDLVKELENASPKTGIKI